VSEDSKKTLSFLTGEAILTEAFERLRPRLLAMINRRIGTKGFHRKYSRRDSVFLL
jgi:hypothetical protein